MAIDWDTTTHYVMKFTADGRAEIFDASGVSMPAYQRTTQLIVRVAEGEVPVLVAKGPIE